MVASIAFVIAMQAQAQAPVLPAGCSPAFQRAVVAVEQSMEAGDFVTAGKRLQLLPKLNPTIRYKDDLAPSNLKETYRHAVDDAIEAWESAASNGLKIKMGSPEDVLVDYGQEMATLPDSNEPAAMATIVSESSLPRIEAVIGLHRGADHRASNAFDVQNDVVYALGQYLGVAPTGVHGTALGHADYPSASPNVITPNEFIVVRENLKAVQILRDAIHSHVKMSPAQPSASVDTDSITYGPVLQGQVASVSFNITNVGSGTLTYALRPDCSCISAGAGGSLGPGQSRVVDIRVETITWDRTLKKNVLLLTNDPETPAKQIPIEIKVEPRFRWIVPGGPNRVVGDSGSDTDVYLDLPLNANITPTGVRFEGIPGKVTIEPWSGMLPDPDRGEPARQRDGFHFKVHVAGELGPGRPNGAVVLETSNPDFPEIRYLLGFQKGIVAMPDSLNLGLIGSIQRPRSFFLSRPGKPFRVLSISSTPSIIKTAIGKVPETGDYRVMVTLDGKVPTGDFLGVIHVFTDDPRQPKIDIRVSGIGQ